MLPASSMAMQCPLTKKMPALRKTGDQQIDQDNQLHRTALVEIIESLWANPQDTLACGAWLKARIDARVVTVQENMFKSPPDTLGQVCGDFICSYWKSRFALGDELLVKIKAWEPDSLRNSFFGMLNCQSGLKFGDEAQNKAVLSFALDARLLQCQSMPKLVPGVNVDLLTGEIDYAKFAVYQVEIAENKAARMKHVPTGEFGPIDSDLCVTADWELKDNWSQNKAALVKNKRKYFVRDFFVKGVGPHCTPSLTGQNDAWKRLIAQAVRKEAIRKEASAEGELVAIATEEFNKAKKAKATAGAELARQGLKEKQDQREKKRRVSLQGSVVVSASSSSTPAVAIVLVGTGS